MIFLQTTVFFWRIYSDDNKCIDDDDICMMDGDCQFILHIVALLVCKCCIKLHSYYYSITVRI